MDKINKKVLFTAHTIKDVKLYLSLFERSITDHNLLTFRLSSFLFARINGIKAKTMFHIPLLTSIIPTLSYIKQSNCNIDTRFYSSFKIKKNYFKKSFFLYKKYIDKHIQHLAFDIVFLTGESRINEQALLESMPRSKILFWEAGPKGQIYFSKFGVNANARFSNDESGLSHKFNCLCAPTEEKLKTNNSMNLYFKAIELIYILFMRSILMNKEMNEVLPKFNLFLPKKEIFPTNYPEEYILFIDQVELDVNSTHFSISIEEIVKKINNLISILKIKKPNIKLIRRAHPRQLHTEISENLSKKFNTLFINSSKGTLDEAINGASFVLTVNSTGGLDSLLLGKPVHILGKSYYQDLYGVIDEKDLKPYLEGKLNLERELVIKEAQSFISKNFVPIDFRGGNFKYFSKFDNFLVNLK
tara:strand:+ start:2286 stop:3530 length:1245 start_codon:yes stop_codon:yes gene_type:complete